MGNRRFAELSQQHQIAIATYGAKMLALLRRDLPYEQEQDGLKPPPLLITGTTRAKWIEFSDHVEQLLRPSGEFQEISGFANKLAEHAARIAAVLQVFHAPDAEEMDLDHLRRGIELAEFYASEALRLHSASRIGVELRDAERLRLWLIDRWNEPYVTVRAIQQRGPTSLREKGRIERLLDVLEAHHWVAQASSVTVDGKPTRTAWAIWGKAS